ncbi:Hypothetical protein FKW44_009810 [Caligus rogercresseyi]|uniref:Uncharacterized protein n=1 Tax=Caligus rogercresseyi TaxID=217165 RepID=A0A7T8HFW0_CALRO|nr:Hypothetical protein FKW44_009810 [Caligus rogercresseyi]
MSTRYSTKFLLRLTVFIQQGINIREYSILPKRTGDAVLLDNGFEIGIEVEEDGGNEGFLPGLTKLAWTKNDHHEELAGFLSDPRVEPSPFHKLSAWRTR